MVVVKSFPRLLPLCESFFKVDELRKHIDRRIMALSPEDPGRAVLWHELEAVLVTLGDMFSQLTQCRASDIAELRAKAAVLTIMQQFDDSADGPVTQEEKLAFALSLADNTLTLLS